MLPDRLAGNRQYCLDKAAECDRKAAHARDPHAAKEFQSLGCPSALPEQRPISQAVKWSVRAAQSSRLGGLRVLRDHSRANAAFVCA